MIAVITGDIINSESQASEKWLPALKSLLQQWGSTPADWDVYRGDEFQLKCKTEDALQWSLLIKSLLRTTAQLDARIAIGVGEETFTGASITESNGTTYVNSGRLLDALKISGDTLAISTDDPLLDTDINIMLRWALLQFDQWTPAVAQIVHRLLLDPGATQESLARELTISQSSVSQRLKRAHFDLIKQTDTYYRTKIQQLQ